MADDKDGIKKTNFNPKWATKFIIHGFIDTPLSNWVSEMRDELIVRKNLNVIVVDWAGGSLPLYTQVNEFNYLFFPSHETKIGDEIFFFCFRTGYSKYTISWFRDCIFDKKITTRT